MKFDNYIGKFASSGDVQTALNDGDLIKPYIALVEGEGIDYNSKDASVDYSKLPLTFEIISGGTINLYWEVNEYHPEEGAEQRTIEYRKNGGEWTEIEFGGEENIINVDSGDIVQFRGDNDSYGSNDTMAYNSFTESTAQFKVYGNIMSLINSTNFSGLTTLSSTNTFTGLFKRCEGLTDASNLILPATTLVSSCYSQMFNSCTSLTTAPELPAITLADSCYRFMFSYCTSLTHAPSILPATTLNSECYVGMFQSCTSLTTAPELPATTLASNCYESMFSRCTGLTTAPELPATTLVSSCYSYMFYGCSSLTTAPELPATTLTERCYSQMFNVCSSLNYIKCLATNISASYCTSNWLANVASSGTFVKNPSMTSWPTGYNGIPNGWTVIDAE